MRYQLDIVPHSPAQIWLLPISLALGLFSFTFIADHFPAFANWLNDHTRAKSLLTTTLPTILVSVISFVVPTLLNQITMAAQNIFMTSRLHDTIMRRYWVWLVINVRERLCACSRLLERHLRCRSLCKPPLSRH